MLKNLQGKHLQMNKLANRCLAEQGDITSPIKKAPYAKALGKLTDRMVPFLKTYEDLEALLQFMEGELRIEKGMVEFTKIMNSETGEKLILTIGVENIDAEIDCLRFKLKEGNPLEYVETLQLFD